MDRRLSPANGRVAAARLKGQVEAEAYVEGQAARVGVPVADLLSAPDGRRDRQLLYGELVTVYEERSGFAFVEARRDGYCGYVALTALGAPADATHIVSVPATHLYPAPDLKRAEVASLSFGARLRIVSGSGAFFETDLGLFIPKPHLRPANKPFTDPASVAQLFFGVPYLWGGNSIRGIDCSGLVQAACLACGIDCPGDSDLQCASLGVALPDEAPLARGDLVFWKGHVAMAVDPETFIHANAHAMAVSYEPVSVAVERIGAEGHPVVARRRQSRPNTA
jgi:cell wall-associated NlpC family hydrolase